MTAIPATDTQFEEVAIDSVSETADGYQLNRADGFCMFIGKTDFVPQAGQTARFYGKGIGRIVRGVSVAGHVAFYRSPEEEEVRRQTKSAKYNEELRQRRAETKVPEVVTPGFEWTEDMAEISGFGGSYERACRQMISQGCAWWSEHPDLEPAFKGFQGLYGLCMEDNEDAKSLSGAVCRDIDPSGAMHQAAIGHVFRWRKLGSWLAYQSEMRARAREQG